MILGELEAGQAFVDLETGIKYRLTVHSRGYFKSIPKVGYSWCIDLSTHQSVVLKRKIEVVVIDEQQVKVN